jgi:hypothetical protein
MRYTIIPSDSLVSVDGVAKAPVELTIDPTIHAVQWYGEFGEIEYSSQFVDGAIVKPNNEVFTDAAQFQDALDAWTSWVGPTPIPAQPE